MICSRYKQYDSIGAALILLTELECIQSVLMKSKVVEHGREKMAGALAIWAVLALEVVVLTGVAGQGYYEVVVPNAGIASMHTAVTHLGNVVLLDRTNIGTSQLNLPDGVCRDNPQDRVRTYSPDSSCSGSTVSTALFSTKLVSRVSCQGCVKVLKVFFRQLQQIIELLQLDCWILNECS